MKIQLWFIVEFIRAEAKKGNLFVWKDVSSNVYQWYWYLPKSYSQWNILRAEWNILYTNLFKLFAGATRRWVVIEINQLIEWTIALAVKFNSTNKHLWKLSQGSSSIQIIFKVYSTITWMTWIRKSVYQICLS